MVEVTSRNGGAAGTEPTFPDDMGQEELRRAIEEYQQWCANNYQALDISLEIVDTEISNRMKRTAGKVISNHSTGNVKCIRYAYGAYKAWGWEQFAETIRHELIHVHTIQNHQTGGHGMLFKRMVEPLDTHRHCETFEEAKYVLYCETCGKRVARRFQKCKIVKKPHRYRSGCCDDSLVVEEN